MTREKYHELATRLRYARLAAGDNGFDVRDQVLILVDVAEELLAAVRDATGAAKTPHAPLPTPHE